MRYRMNTVDKGLAISKSFIVKLASISIRFDKTKVSFERRYLIVHALCCHSENCVVLRNHSFNKAYKCQKTATYNAFLPRLYNYRSKVKVRC